MGKELDTTKLLVNDKLTFGVGLYMTLQLALLLEGLCPITGSPPAPVSLLRTRPNYAFHVDFQYMLVQLPAIGKDFAAGVFVMPVTFALFLDTNNYTLLGSCSAWCFYP